MKGTGTNRLMDERELRCLERLVAGEDAWAEFWEIFGRLIAGEVSAFNGHLESLVDDVFQMLVLKLMSGGFSIIRRHLRQSPGRSFGALLRRIVRNLLIDELRRMKRRGETDLFDGQLSLLGSLLPDHRSGENPDSSRERLARLFQAVAGDAPDSVGFRILHLRFLGGESVISIAEQTGLKPNSVSQRIRYYLRKIREHHLEEIRDLANA